MRHPGDESQRQPRRRATAAMLTILAFAAMATAYHALHHSDVPEDGGVAAKACTEMLRTVETGNKHATAPKTKTKRAASTRKHKHRKRDRQAPTYSGPRLRNPIDSI